MRPWVLACCAFSTLATGADYFVDAEGGSDLSSGHSPGSAWQTVQKVNAAHFEPGDRIRFRRGKAYQGTLSPHGHGTAAAPIVFGAYGHGDLPIIRFTASDRSGIYLRNQSYITIELLRVVGPGKGVAGENYAGIFSEIDRDDLVCSGIRIRNCVVSALGGTALPDAKSAGLISLLASAPGAYYRDVVVEDCEVFATNQWAGIVLYTMDWKRVKSENITFRNCIASDVYGDGIIQYVVRDGVIDNCVVYDVGLGSDPDVGTPNGIWHWASVGGVVRYCESYRVRSPSVDGGAFDIDWGNVDCVVEDSYGHDCDGYGVAIFGARDDVVPTSGTIVRNNLFVNNGREPGANGSAQGDFEVMTWEKGRIGSFQFHNNTSFWNPADNDPAIVIKDAGFVENAKMAIARNLVLSTNGKLVSLWTDKVAFDGNVYGSFDREPVFYFGEEAFGNLHDWTEVTGQDASSHLGFPATGGFGACSVGVGVGGSGSDPSRVRDTLSLLQLPASRGDVGVQYKNRSPHGRDKSLKLDVRNLTGEKGESRKTLLLVGGFVGERGDAVDRESRRYLVYLKSLVRQYRDLGLRFAIVEANARVAPGSLTGQALADVRHERNLPEAVAFGRSSDVADLEPELEACPAIYLLDGQGVVVDRLVGRLHPGLLAQRLATFLGGE